jgi:hypothetical protein
MIYAGAVHIELTAENTEPASGIVGRVVAAILADPSLSDYVRNWARQWHGLEASATSLQRLPLDATYERIRELLRRTGDRSRRAGC